MHCFVVKGLPYREFIPLNLSRRSQSSNSLLTSYNGHTPWKFVLRITNTRLVTSFIQGPRQVDDDPYAYIAECDS